jgi:hypothetical protein
VKLGGEGMGGMGERTRSLASARWNETRCQSVVDELREARQRDIMTAYEDDSEAYVADALTLCVRLAPGPLKVDRSSAVRLGGS